MTKHSLSGKVSYVQEGLERKMVAKKHMEPSKNTFSSRRSFGDKGRVLLNPGCVSLVWCTES